MEFLGPIIEVLNCIGPRFCKYIEYHRKLEEYKKNLIRILDDLEDQKNQIKLRLEAECGFGKLTKTEVDKWLKNVQKIIDETKNIEDTFKKVKCFSHVLRAELVDKKIQEAKEYYEKGISLSSFNSLVIDGPPPVGITLPTTRLAGETTAKKNMEEIASSLKGEEDIHEWRNALHEPSNNVRSIKVNDDEVFIRFRYDRLKDERIQRCFLYCALYPEDHNIPKNELVDCWIAEGLVDEMVNLKATEDMAHSVITSLVSNCLLSESTDWAGRSCVKLHNVVRDMTLKYITSKSPLLMVKAGMKLDELPSEQEWKENLDKVSLMDNLVRNIPSNMWPNCQILSHLFLQDNPLESIPESFFTHMYGLKILNLSRTLIESLPNSISELTNLTALFLQYCRRLKHVPCLARLRALENLELRYTAINEVPAGMEMLANLTSLDLLCSKLHMIPAGILPKLFRLQKLRINWRLETQRVAVEEATRLKNLNSLTAQFLKLQDFNCYMNSLNSYGILSEYCFRLSSKDLEDSDMLDLSYWRFMYDVNKVVILEGCNICGREEDSIVLPKEVEFLFIRCCGVVGNISDIPTFNTLKRLEILHVQNVYNLSGILLNVSESSPAGQYSHLKFVRIYESENLEKLISSKLMLELKNLELIDVFSCRAMEELIVVDDDDDNELRSPREFLLPKLKSLSLRFMPKLKSICSCNGLVMVCDSLQVIDLWRCPKLKKILTSSSKLQLGVLKNLEEIKVGTCDEMEEIITIDDVDCKKELMISLPKLRNLHLRGMRELKSIINVCGNNREMVCDSLQQIYMQSCPKLKKILLSSSELQLGVLKNLEEIKVGTCDEMEEIIAIDDVDCKKELMISLPKLRNLTLGDMPKLNSIINVCGSNGVMVCDSLQQIYIRYCPKLKKILSSSSFELQLGVLKNLEEIKVGTCDEMEEIIEIDDVDCKKELMISLPKLRNLNLRHMQELKSIVNVCGSNGVMVCDSLQEVEIWECPQLKRFPIYLPIDQKGRPSTPPALNKITVQKEWWEALEWDHLHPHAKTLLLPFCQFDPNFHYL